MNESRREREFNSREQDILTTAIILFTKQGLDNVTVAEIAKVADIGKGTIYKHFASKDVIMARLGNDFSRGVLTKLSQINTEKTCVEQMRSMLKICFYEHLENPLMSEIYQVYQQPRFIERLPEHYQKKCKEIEGEYLVILTRIIELGINSKELPNLPIDELMLGAYATYCGSLQMLQNKFRRCFTESPQLSSTCFIDILINYTITGLFGRRFDISSSEFGEVNE